MAAVNLPGARRGSGHGRFFIEGHRVHQLPSQDFVRSRRDRRQFLLPQYRLKRFRHDFSCKKRNGANQRACGGASNG
jgi:hypothetical protein